MISFTNLTKFRRKITISDSSSSGTKKKTDSIKLLLPSFLPSFLQQNFEIFTIYPTPIDPCCFSLTRLSFIPVSSSPMEKEKRKKSFSQFSFFRLPTSLLKCLESLQFFYYLVSPSSSDSSSSSSSSSSCCSFLLLLHCSFSFFLFSSSSCCCCCSRPLSPSAQLSRFKARLRPRFLSSAGGRSPKPRSGSLKTKNK